MLILRQITGDQAHLAHAIQKRSFEPLLEKYHDYDINPAMESVERVREKIDFDNTTAYVFQMDGMTVGWVRIIELEAKTFKISALCVLPEYQGRGIAQAAMKQIERNHPDARKWILNTILQEERNCHLYEKLGYVQTGELKQINECMTLVHYEKVIYHAG